MSSGRSVLAVSLLHTVSQDEVHQETLPVDEVNSTNLFVCTTAVDLFLDVLSVITSRAIRRVPNTERRILFSP